MVTGRRKSHWSHQRHWRWQELIIGDAGDPDGDIKPGRAYVLGLIVRARGGGSSIKPNPPFCALEAAPQNDAMAATSAGSKRTPLNSKRDPVNRTTAIN